MLLSYRSNLELGDGVTRLPKLSVLMFLAIPALSGSASSANIPKEMAELSITQSQSQATQLVSQFLSFAHYDVKPVDNAVSARWLEAYLESLDPQRLFFLKPDVDAFKKLANELDDDARQPEPTLDIAVLVFEQYRQRAESAYAYGATVLEGPMTFEDPSASITADRSEAPYPKNEEARQELWRQRVHSQVLDAILLGESFEDARQKVQKRTQRSLIRLKQMDARDMVEVYLTSLASTYDPHSAYFSPASSEDFDIRMRDALEGIGAELRFDDGYTKIVRLIAGGPAASSGLLQKGDLILAVGQDDEPPVDVVEMRLDDVVKLIRGKKGTTVRLTIRPAASPASTKIVTLVRDRVVLEKVSAKAEMHTVKQERGKALKIGVIDVPSFYSDGWAGDKDADPRSTTRDVHKHIVHLAGNGMDALVIDLRGNGGGALSEALSLTGLFIDRGPVVQVRDPRDGVKVLDDPIPGVAWSGPLVVLTDELSASASEIFAGAIQDYGRGLIVGAPQTHGKGTVQQVLDLSRFLKRAEREADVPRLGALKLTVQKFYRVSGGSTQLRGVQPDVVLPSPWQGLDVLEEDLEGALSYDEIPKASYERAPIGVDLNALSSASRQRLEREQVIGWLRDDLAQREARQAEGTVSLHLPTRTKELEAELEERNARRATLGLPAVDPLAEPEDKPEDGKIHTVGDAMEAAILQETLAITSEFTRAWTPSLDMPPLKVRDLNNRR